MSGGSNAGAQAAAQQAQQQQAIENATAKINKAFSGFDSNFYNQRTNAYENYALPQLGQQLQRTQDQLSFKLAGQGLQNSGAAKKLGESLATEEGTQKQNVANQALSQTQGLQQQIAQQQSNLINQANVANDPGSVATQAISTASNYAAPSPMPAIGNLFQNWANMYLGSVNNNNANTAASGISPYAGATGGYGSSFGSLQSVK